MSQDQHPRCPVETYLYKAELSRRCLFTEQILNEAKAVHEKLKTGDLKEPGTELDVNNINGTPVKLTVPNYNREEEQLWVRLVDYHEISEHFDHEGNLKAGTKETDLLPFKLETYSKSVHVPEDDCGTPNTGQPWGYWNYKWQSGQVDGKDWRLARQKDDTLARGFTRDLSEQQMKSVVESGAKWLKTRTHLIEVIKEHEEELKDIDQIVCFALGPITQKRARPFVQHLAVMTIQETLIELRGDRAPKVIFQDPLYCDNCERVLERELGFKDPIFTAGFGGFDALLEKNEANKEKTSLVVCIAPSAPVIQVVLDITSSYGGPAAMLCCEIRSEDNVTLSESRYKIADKATFNLLQYAGRCKKSPFGDGQIVAGMTVDEIDEAIVEIAEKAGMENTLLRAIKPLRDAGAGQDLIDKCQDLLSKRVGTKFPDLMAYVKDSGGPS
ncbi:hypothetical protein EJ04DRAFT_551374 [Polyplosphaeria fusca]|uniref:SRR1-like domain-containing protein n=1 Tax=Polyplosphaeria fusca TaxID=682080 RepID=A0A9P4R3T6_9PLEO|nr:hypothetical protein EJ04DRAFT_551374 [Polyplosphaeria fusca]